MKTVELLKDPDYRKYFLRVPKFPYELASPRPWTVWAKKSSAKRPGRFVWTAMPFEDFKQSWQVVRNHYKNWEDFSITSMIIGFKPPKHIMNMIPEMEWCYRCRRPVDYRTFSRHHALDRGIHQWFSNWPVCPYCGFSGDTSSLTVVSG